MRNEDKDCEENDGLATTGQYTGIKTLFHA
jgi:hypothetical protein